MNLSNICVQLALIAAAVLLVGAVRWVVYVIREMRLAGQRSRGKRNE